MWLKYRMEEGEMGKEKLAGCADKLVLPGKYAKHGCQPIFHPTVSIAEMELALYFFSIKSKNL